MHIMSNRKIDAGDEIHVYVSPESVGAYLNADDCITTDYAIRHRQS